VSHRRSRARARNAARVEAGQADSPLPAPASAWRSGIPEVERQIAANFADRALRRRIRAELRGSVAAWGLSRSKVAEILQGLAEELRAEDEADRRRSR
jgi:hypothetical protein